MTNKKEISPLPTDPAQNAELKKLLPEPDSLGTGTGGFSIDGKTFTYDVGVPDAQGGPQGNVDHGNVKVDNSKKDLSKPTKKTLAEYLSDVTMGKKGSSPVPNRYPVDHIVRPEVSLTDTKGNPAPVEPVPLGQNNSFFTQSPGDSFSQDYSTISPDIKKGKTSNPGVDGNDLLSGDVTKDPVKKYTSAVLGHNRFTADGAHMIGDADVSQPAALYNPQLVHGKALGSSAGGDTVSMGRLATIGPTLTMRAGIELGSGQSGFNPNSGAGTAGALLPGVAQLAVRRIEQQMLNAKDVLNSLTTGEPPEKLFISPGSLSWGALNNTEDQYTGIAALGMAALSAAMVAGLLLIIDGLSLILGLIKPGSTAATHDNQGRYALGKYFAGQKPPSGGLLGAATAILSLDIGGLLGINPTFMPFPQALKTGANAFFGIEDGGVLGQLAGAALDALGPDAGFNAIVARAIVRSSLTIVDALKGIGGSPVNIIKGILSFIEVLRASKIISAINVFATLGDAILTLPEDWVDQDALGGRKVSQTDSLSDNEGAVAKNRLQGSLKLAWSSNRSPANLLVSQNIAAVSRIATKLGAFDTHVTLDPQSRIQMASIKQDAAPRIDPDAAALFERQLDAEYVPFYFHDLRTNEMVGFHAFLASLTDDYTANYENVEAYGRVEPVKIYKSTQRRISMSFYVISTSPSDFTHMWVKLNKLVTLVYPQFTAGKQIQNEAGTYKLTQPFSQLIGAAPMIRIRLGDLLRSNYSRFNLARLFGLGNTQFTLNSKVFSNFSKVEQEKLDKDLPAKIETLKTTAGETFIAAQGYFYVQPPPSAGISISPPFGGSSGPENAAKFVPTGNPDFFEVKVVEEFSDDPRLVVGEIQLTTDPEYLATLGDTSGITKAYGDTSKPTTNVIGGKYLFPKHTLHPTQKTHDKAVDEIVALADDPFITELGTFLDTQKNAVAKSFKNTGGKGLAGFIDTMNFDWYDKVVWETGNLNRIAPRMCKVTISFSPIHDITPGLDHFGVNRAPVYPVGQMAPRPEPKE